MIKIVGSFLGIHDNGFSLIENNNIVACYSDERFSRVKSAHRQYTFPQPSLDAIQKDFNINIKDSNIILASAKPVNESVVASVAPCAIILISGSTLSSFVPASSPKYGHSYPSQFLKFGMMEM